MNDDQKKQINQFLEHPLFEEFKNNFPEIVKNAENSLGWLPIFEAYLTGAEIGARVVASAMERQAYRIRLGLIGTDWIDLVGDGP